MQFASFRLAECNGTNQATTDQPKKSGSHGADTPISTWNGLNKTLTKHKLEAKKCTYSVTVGVEKLSMYIHVCSKIQYVSKKRLQEHSVSFCKTLITIRFHC